jgi:uncharacterized membrane protein YphA (DoxX/SURF4 family)
LSFSAAEFSDIDAMSSQRWTTVTRLDYLRYAVVGAYLCGILFSPRLWFGLGRSFPRAPLVGGLPSWLSSADYVLTILLVAALLLSLISRRSNRYLFSAMLFTVLLVLFDQARLQPWVYQYGIMLALLSCRPPHATESLIATSVLIANQLVIALLYFWSGAQKLNWSFVHEVIPTLFESVRIHLPVSYLAAIGIAVALFEMLIGIGLIIQRTRQIAVVVAVGMHLLLLLLLIVTWHNSVVWPWNVAMTIVVVSLNWRVDQPVARRELWQWRGYDLAGHLPKAVVVICGLAPALSLVGWWDLYLSASLYSGKTPVAVVRIDDGLRNRLSVVAQQQVFTTSSGELMLPFYEWSLADLNVPPYPEVRVYRQVARQLCVLADERQGIELIIKERPALIDGNSNVTRTLCADLRR